MSVPGSWPLYVDLLDRPPLIAAQGWTLKAAQVRSRNGVLQLNFSVSPDGIAGVGEYIVATTSASVNALAPGCRQEVPWYATGGLHGVSLWDESRGVVYIRTTRVMQAGTACHLSLALRTRMSA